MRRDPEMDEYLYAHGWHFNDKMQEFAASLMTKAVNGVEEAIKPFSKEQVDEMLTKYGVVVRNKNKCLMDYVYLANKCQADYLKSSVTDEQHMAMYIKDELDDIDAPEGMVFAMWYGKMNRAGIPIPWRAML